MYRKKLMLTGIIALSINTAIPGNMVLGADIGQVQAQTSESSSTDSETEHPPTELPQTEPPQTEPPQTELPQTEPPQTEPPQTELPQTEPPQTESPQTEAPQTDSSQIELPQTNSPQIEVPQTDSPQTEVPQTEVPQTEPSQLETSQTQNNEPLAGDFSDRLIQENNSPYKTNEELLAHQNIVKPDIKKDFRFTQVDGTSIIVKKGAFIYEEKKEDAKKVGKASVQSYAYILKDDGNWFYIESGKVRGFVKKEDVLITDKVAEIICARNSMNGLSSLIPSNQNKALTYTLTTTRDVVVDKYYALSMNAEVEIYEEKNSSSRVVGIMPQNGIAYVLADKNDDFMYVESDSVRGFVKKEKVIIGSNAEKLVKEKKESSFHLAKEKISPEENAACYYTMDSVQKANDLSMKRKSMIEFAQQFVGNPYVWGGTSLTHGADCSGFVQTIYATYGYSIPRVACDQAVYGTQIPIESAQPGDLIFYSRNGYVYHVSMYIGNGQVVQAYSSQRGIITSEIGPNAIWATNIIG